RDVAHRKGVAGTDLRALAALEAVADLHVARGEDVALLAVEVVEQSDPAVAVRVVLDGRDLGRHAILGATEVDQTVLLLVATTLVAGGLAPVGGAGAGTRLWYAEVALGGGLGGRGEARGRLEATTWAGGLALAELHGPQASLKRSIESPSASVTMARLRSVRGPSLPVRRLRVVLPLRFSVFTLVTF